MTTTELQPAGAPTTPPANVGISASDTMADLDQRRAGILVLAMSTDAQFASTMRQLKLAMARLKEIKQNLLTPTNAEGEGDYGVVPGTKKPTLLKPGAEKLCMFARLAPRFVVQRSLGDDENSPAIHYLVTCQLHLGNTQGPVIAEGVGSCNSWERKYRYRFAQRTCPTCNVQAIMRSAYEDRTNPGEKGWYCNKRKNGCGAQFAYNDPKIVDQNAGEVENADPFDLDNTLLKMARKRAYIDATLTGTASSGEFTQDLEDEGAPAMTAAEREAMVKRFADAVRRGDPAAKIGALLGFANEALGRADLKDLNQITKLDGADLLVLALKAEERWPVARPNAEGGGEAVE